MKKLTVVFATLALMLGFASTASAQHHPNGNHGVYTHGGQRGGYDRDYRGGYDRDYRGGYRGDGYRRGGIDIIIGGRPGYPYPYPYPNGGWNIGGYSDTRIVFERVYDEYGRSYTIRHVALWDNYYRGYVWYDQNGNLRVN